MENKNLIYVKDFPEKGFFTNNIILSSEYNITISTPFLLKEKTDFKKYICSLFHLKDIESDSPVSFENFGLKNCLWLVNQFGTFTITTDQQYETLKFSNPHKINNNLILKKSEGENTFNTKESIPFNHISFTIDIKETYKYQDKSIFLNSLYFMENKVQEKELENATIIKECENNTSLIKIPKYFIQEYNLTGLETYKYTNNINNITTGLLRNKKFLLPNKSTKGLHELFTKERILWENFSKKGIENKVTITYKMKDNILKLNDDIYTLNTKSKLMIYRRVSHTIVKNFIPELTLENIKEWQLSETIESRPIIPKKGVVGFFTNLEKYESYNPPAAFFPANYNASALWIGKEYTINTTTQCNDLEEIDLIQYCRNYNYIGFILYEKDNEILFITQNEDIEPKFMESLEGWTISIKMPSVFSVPIQIQDKTILDNSSVIKENDQTYGDIVNSSRICSNIPIGINTTLIDTTFNHNIIWEKKINNFYTLNHYKNFSIGDSSIKIDTDTWLKQNSYTNQNGSFSLVQYNAKYNCTECNLFPSIIPLISSKSNPNSILIDTHQIYCNGFSMFDIASDWKQTDFFQYVLDVKTKIKMPVLPSKKQACFSAITAFISTSNDIFHQNYQDPIEAFVILYSES